MMSGQATAQSGFSLTIDMPLPPSANALFANAKGGRVKTKEYNAWLNDARYAVIMAWRGAGKPVCPPKVPMMVYARIGLTGRMRDLTNCIKACEDILTKELPVPDDRWNDRVLFERDESLDGIARVTICELRPAPT